MKNATKGFVLTLVILALARLVAMVVFPVFDPSEGRYAAICANMAASGDFLVPRFIHDGIYQSFDGKPPLLFQLGGLFCSLLGRHELAVRLPPFLSAVGILGILFLVMRRVRDTLTARMAVLFCATSVAFYATAGMCMTDLPLTFCVSGALLLECAFIQSPNKWTSRAIFALLGLGMLIKGPVALALFGLPVLLDAWANRRMKLLARHSWFVGPLIFLLISAPWYILMERQTPGFLNYFFIHENLLRFLVHNYGDKYGAGRETFRGMAIIWAVVVTLPWSPLLFFRRGGLRLRDGEPATLLTWGILAITGFWCLTSRVPLAYLLPIVPLFAARLALMERLPAWTARLVPVAVAICLVALIGTFTATSLFSDKMSGWQFRTIRAAEPSRGVFFSGTEAPYSAEFYFGSQLHLTPKEGDLTLVEEGNQWKEVK